jgi:hypothetical protein
MKEIDFIHYPWVVFKNTNSTLADALVADTRASATRALRESKLAELLKIIVEGYGYPAAQFISHRDVPFLRSIG